MARPVRRAGLRPSTAEVQRPFSLVCFDSELGPGRSEVCWLESRASDVLRLRIEWWVVGMGCSEAAGGRAGGFASSLRDANANICPSFRDPFRSFTPPTGHVKRTARARSGRVGDRQTRHSQNIVETIQVDKTRFVRSGFGYYLIGKWLCRTCTVQYSTRQDSTLSPFQPTPERPERPDAFQACKYLGNVRGVSWGLGRTKCTGVKRQIGGEGVRVAGDGGSGGMEGNRVSAA